MKREIKYRIYKQIAVVLAFSMLFQIFFPTAALALTSGPSAPEFSSFEPVATTNMVNEFTGDFTYNLPVLNIPGANGGGYALSLSYHSGEGMESEASWVGYGWSLNPGAINRIKRGFPDDSKGDQVTYHNDVPANWTATVGAHAGNIEAFSKDVPLSANVSIRYNNYRGFGCSAGAGISFRKGLVSLGYSVSNTGEGSFSLGINPAALLKQKSQQATEQDNQGTEKAAQSGRSDAEEQAGKANTPAEAKKHKEKETFEKKVLGNLGGQVSSYGMQSLSDVVRPTTVIEYTGYSINGTLSLEACPAFVAVGSEVGVFGSFSRQVNEKKQNIPTYGYMYSGTALDDADAMMDYYAEKESSYNKRDKYLSIPFSNADMFSLSGEGLGGGFKLHSRTAGHFRPNNVKSSLNICNAGLEINFATNVGPGGDAGIGWQNLEVSGEWDGVGNTEDYQFPEVADENYFFRFNNDLGGNVVFPTNDDAVNAYVRIMWPTKGEMRCAPYVRGLTSSGMNSTIGDVNRSGRSSYIGYHTNKEMSDLSSSGIEYYAYDKNQSTNKWIDRNDGIIENGIGEIVVFNEEGNRYVYGLPVYSRKERNLQYGLGYLPASSIEKNYIAYKNILDADKKVGEERNAPYATTYLLTEITTPDYVDRKMDGVDDDDFGGYTRFVYDRVYGTDDKDGAGDWYQWRIPYNGLLYQAGDMVDDHDDMGGVSCGEKEIYYLDTIETKTHIAVFKTSPRSDGFPATDSVTAAQTKNAKPAANELQRLDSIMLYAKPTNGSNNYKLIQKVNFEYEYELCKELPNASNSSTGKLTLKRVWFEYEGIVNAKISPYQFEYNYPSATDADYPTKYDHFQGYGVQVDSLENPDYNAFDLDRWGNYQYNGDSCHNNMIPWVDQVPDTTKFDPAAWQLKVIKLPSGGEIHVQYEQDDYLYVQDRRATAMVSLTESDNGTGNKFYLDVDTDLGITDLDNKRALAKLIRDTYKDDGVTQENKIFFKFLYALTPFKNAALRNGNSDYVTGYVRLDDAGVNGDGKLWVELNDDDNDELPYKVCQDYVKAEKSGKLNPSKNMDASTTGTGNKDEVIDILYELLSLGAVLPKSTCLTIDVAHSYFRIPVLNLKKGGGVRVKRLLMYDNGIETGDVNLYGSEYVYQTTEGKSSGVATNEPSEGREENALIDLLIKRDDQKWWSKIISGKNKEQFEGPIGETILPSPSVGYSRVVVKNIHSGKTNTGIVVNEFYTAKDYPFDKYYSHLGKAVKNTDIEDVPDWMIAPLLLVNQSITNVWLSQGYRFIQNNMHGQAKAVTTYSGDYGNINKPNETAKSSSQEFTYFEPGETVPMMYDVGDIRNENPGKEVEVLFEIKSVTDRCKDINVEWDVDAAVLPFPLFSASVCPSISYTESELRTHVTTKVINYPAIQKSVKSYQDGIYHLTENLAFNPHTGKPILTRTTDGYNELDLLDEISHNGKYYNYTIPASLKYEEMSQKAMNERKLVIKSSSPGNELTMTRTGSEIKFAGDNLCDAMSGFIPGDLLKISKSSSVDFCHMDSIKGDKIYVTQADIYDGALVNGSLDTIEVLRSGRTNQLNAVAGTITSYGDTSITYHAISDLAERKAYANALTLLINSGSNGTIVSDPGFVKLAIIDPSYYPECYDCEDSIKAIFNKSYSVLSWVITGGGVTWCDNPLPCSKDLVADGNDYGTFSIDTISGALVYYHGGINCNPPTLITCINFCTDEEGFSSAKMNAISANATTYSDDWAYNTSDYPLTDWPGSLNNYELGKKGKWRAKDTYVYRDSIIGGARPDEKVYKDAGVFDLALFNWKYSEANDTTKWLKLNTVTKYSPDGSALEEKNILGIYSAAKFGYKNTMPYMVAQNADYGSVQFESFENVYEYNGDSYLEDGLKISNSSYVNDDYAHSGSFSYKLGFLSGTNSINLDTVTLTSQMRAKGLSIKLWVRDPKNYNDPITGTLGNIYLNYTKIARTGEWTLYEAKVSTWGYLPEGEKLIPVIINKHGGDYVWIDDVRIQPMDAQAVCYVYDVNTLRLLTSFDDQHFGLYYQYNAEGKLVRKLMETERGVKTVQETQYHTPAKVTR